MTLVRGFCAAAAAALRVLVRAASAVACKNSRGRGPCGGVDSSVHAVLFSFVRCSAFRTPFAVTLTTLTSLGALFPKETKLLEWCFVVWFGGGPLATEGFFQFIEEPFRGHFGPSSLG